MCKTNKPIDEFYGHGKYRNCKTCHNTYTAQRWKDRKRKAIVLMGGECQDCGYQKCSDALHFHHLDPRTKEHKVCEVFRKEWKTIVMELKKCILLCSNCHIERHSVDGSCENSGKDNPRLNYEFKPTGTCPVCNNHVFGTIYCGINCSSRARRKTKRPGRNKLKEEIKTMSWLAIGRKYNVSDNAVRKWARSYGLI
jgi:hypothetical protein